MMKLGSSLANIIVTAFLLIGGRENGRFAVLADQLVDQAFGGRNIGEKEYEWFTTLLVEDTKQFLCSGFLVSKRHVITANHCVERSPSRTGMIVEVGYLCRDGFNCRRDHDFVRVRRWDHHEGGADMVILTLEESVSINVQPAVPYLGSSFHPQQDFMKSKSKGREMELVGAGRAGFGQVQTFYVRKLEVTPLSRKQCRRMIGDGVSLTKEIVCSIPSEGNPCEGDSGGPVVVPGKRQFAGRDVVMAVHSQGRLRCDSLQAADKPILHVRLDDAAALIISVVCEGESPPEDWCPANVRGDMLQTMVGHRDFITGGGLSFNSDGSRLLSASIDGTNKLWNPLGGSTALATFADPTGARVWVGKFHPVENYFASASDEDAVRLWVTDETDAPFTTFAGIGNAGNSLCWSPCGTKLASSAAGGSIKVWSVITRRLLATLTGNNGQVLSLSFHPDGTKLASGLVNGAINVWDTSTNSFDLVRTLMKHTRWVTSVSYSPDGKHLASGSTDGAAVVWDVKTGKIVHEFNEGGNDVNDVAWSPDSRLIAAACSDGTVRVWDAWNGGSSLVGLEHESAVGSVVWSPDGSILASGMGVSGNIVVWLMTR